MRRADAHQQKMRGGVHAPPLEGKRYVPSYSRETQTEPLLTIHTAQHDMGAADNGKGIAQILS